MGAGINKVLLDLRGESVLRHAVRPFLTCREIAGVCVVCKPSEQDRIRQALQGDADRVTLVSGGETRQESVLAGLRALPADAEFVLVHDGARPLVTERIVADCIVALRAEGSAVACTRVSDTIKRAEGGMVQGTVPRDGLRAPCRRRRDSAPPICAAPWRRPRRSTRRSRTRRAPWSASGCRCAWWSAGT